MTKDVKLVRRFRVTATVFVSVPSTVKEDRVDSYVQLVASSLIAAGPPMVYEELTPSWELGSTD